VSQLFEVVAGVEVPDLTGIHEGFSSRSTARGYHQLTVNVSAPRLEEVVTTLARHVSSPGFLDGTPGARERAGLPRDTGPWRVVTPWAVFDYVDRRLRLIARAPWVTVDEILDECEWKPLLADEIERIVELAAGAELSWALSAPYSFSSSSSALVPL